MRQLAALALILAFLLISVNLTRADCVDENDCQNQINQQNSSISSIKNQQSSLQKSLDAAKKNLNSTTAQLNELQKQVSDIQAQLSKVEADLKGAQSILDKNKELFAVRVRDLYIRGDISGWELLFDKSYSFADAAQFAGLKLATVKRNQSQIAEYTTAVGSLSASQAQLAESNKTATEQLAEIQAIRNAQAAQVSNINRQQSALNSQISQINSSIKNLTSRQQEIIAAKLAATSQGTSLGGAAPSSTTLPTPPFSPSFTFLTYGYPHRIGMNQYGAYGRALAGQDYITILNAYYKLTPVKSIEDTTYTIRVANVTRGSNCSVAAINSISSMSMRTYLYGLGEMPASWPIQALKAQAVAGRTYALYIKNSGKYSGYGFDIGSDTCDQAYNGGNKGLNWSPAVEQSNGEVLGGNNPIGAFYSSTDGGFTCTDFSHVDPCTKYLTDSATGTWSSADAWDGPNHGNSPWFHKAWGDRAGGSAYNPWLSATEAADIFNALLLSQTDPSTNQYLTQPDKGGWSPQQVINELHSRGKTDVGAVANIAVGVDNNGNTTSISVVGANTSYVFDGKAFRAMFNLRSIGTLIIWTSFFDAQKAN